jgi:hypothetical protein
LVDCSFSGCRAGKWTAESCQAQAETHCPIPSSLADWRWEVGCNSCDDSGCWPSWYRGDQLLFYECQDGASGCRLGGWYSTDCYCLAVYGGCGCEENVLNEYCTFSCSTCADQDCWPSWYQGPDDSYEECRSEGPD